jgi:hypothetical protein
MSEIVNVNLDGLVKALMSIKGATPATFEAVTLVKMNKTSNPYHDRVTKRQKSNVFINFNYANAVNKQLLKEGKDADFVSKPRVWGVHVPGTPLILHKNEYYLEARFLNNEPKTEYMLDGAVEDKAVFETFLPAKKEVKSQGTEKEIIIRDFKITGMRSITFGGKTYVRTDV